LVFHDRVLVVELIQLTLNHGLFVVRAAQTLAEWQPDITVVDMDQDDSTALLMRLGATSTSRTWSACSWSVSRRLSAASL
jgi:hypothetical protein